MNRISALFLASIVALTSTLVAQQTASPFPGLFSEVLDVRVINVEVTVTDRDGTPISGLKPEDFRLLVDGEEVPVEYFSEIRGGIAVAGPGDGAVDGIPALAPGEPVGTSYLVFIDDFFSLARDRNVVLEGLKKEVARMQPEDRMAVVAFDGRDLEMISTWSSSYLALERAFETAMRRPAFGLHRTADRRQFEVRSGTSLDDLVSYDGDAGLAPFFDRRSFDRGLEPQERAYLSRLSGQVNRSVAAATATLRSFAMPPGRKVMILLSGGWPFIPADYVVGDLSRLIVSHEGPFGENIYGRLAETANLIGYTLYPVDVPGLDFEFSSAASSARAPRRVAGFDPGYIRESSVHATLGYLANQTGGRALINAARIDVFEKVVADTRSYYWLGFSPQRDWNDERHRLVVEMANPEFRTRQRSGFLDSSRETEVNMAVESSLLFGGSAASNELSVEVGAPTIVEKKRMEVPITVSFALDEVTFLPIGEEQVARLELRVAVLDENGNQGPIPAIPVGINLPEQPSPGLRGSYQTQLLLRQLEHKAVVAVHDLASGRILTARFEVSP